MLCALYSARRGSFFNFLLWISLSNLWPWYSFCNTWNNKISKICMLYVLPISLFYGTLAYRTNKMVLERCWSAELGSDSGSGCTGRKARSPLDICRSLVTALLRCIPSTAATFNRHPKQTRSQQEYFRSKVCLLAGRLRSVDRYKHLSTFRTNAVSLLGFLDPAGGGNKLLTCRHDAISQTSSRQFAVWTTNFAVSLCVQWEHLGEGGTLV
jgi:hypothetical protein